MRLKLSTRVNQDYLAVKDGFNEKLFLKLSPPFPPVKLIQFDGCSKGDKVHLELNFLLFKQHWISEIIQDSTNDVEFKFVDVGVKLPFFLKSWRHEHIVKRNSDNSSQIIDAITFRSSFLLTDYLLFPALFLQFSYRKPIYKKMFRG